MGLLIYGLQFRGLVRKFSLETSRILAMLHTGLAIREVKYTSTAAGWSSIYRSVSFLELLSILRMFFHPNRQGAPQGHLSNQGLLSGSMFVRG